MRIVQLKGSNFMRLEAIELTPEGDVVEITGANEAGKSSLLKLIQWGIGGAADAPDVIIREGADKATFEADLGSIVVQRSQTHKTPTLRVIKKETIEGQEVRATLSTPQAVLDEFRNAIAFDPGEYSRLDDKKQLETLRKLTGVDTDQVDHEIRQAEIVRTNANRDATRAQGAFEAAMKELPPDCPQEEVDVVELVNAVTAAMRTNDHNQRQRDMLEATRRDVDQAQDLLRNREGACEDVTTRHNRELEQISDRQAREVQALRNRHAEESKELEQRQESEHEAVLRARDQMRVLVGTKRSDVEKLEAEVNALPPDENIDAHQQQLSKANADNELARKYLHVRELENDANKAKTWARTQQANLESMREKREQLIGSAKMPVEGLGFGDGCVTYKGLPLSQASSAEALRVSMAIAMELNPKLRVILLHNASLFDSKHFAVIKEMAHSHDPEGAWQIWAERVDETGEVGFYIEDGRLAAIDGEPVVTDAELKEEKLREQAESEAEAADAAAEDADREMFGEDAEGLEDVGHK